MTEQIELTKDEKLLEAINEFRGSENKTVGFIVMAFEEQSFQSFIYRIENYSAISAVSILKHHLLESNAKG